MFYPFRFKFLFKTIVDDNMIHLKLHNYKSENNLFLNKLKIVIIKNIVYN